MLTDDILIPKARIALFGKEVFFNAKTGYDLYNIRTLIYNLSSHWKIILIGLLKEKSVIDEVVSKLNDFGISLEQVVVIDATWNEQRIKGLVHNCDIVYADCLGTLPVKIHSILRPPYDTRQAAQAVAYFSNSAEPFDRNTYYSFLTRTN
jgi:hypothetical protein